MGPRKGRTMQQNIDKSGRETYEKGGQITVLTDKQCDVKSQTEEGKMYRVSYGLDKFTCVSPTRKGVASCRRAVAWNTIHRRGWVPITFPPGAQTNTKSGSPTPHV